EGGEGEEGGRGDGGADGLDDQDAGGGDLAEQLHVRGQRAQVVDEPEGKDDGRADEQAGEVRVVGREQKRADHEGRVNGHAAEQGRGLAVPAVAAGATDRANSTRKAGD